MTEHIPDQHVVETYTNDHGEVHADDDGVFEQFHGAIVEKLRDSSGERLDGLEIAAAKEGSAYRVTSDDGDYHLLIPVEPKRGLMGIFRGTHFLGVKEVEPTVQIGRMFMYGSDDDTVTGSVREIVAIDPEQVKHATLH